MVIAPGSFLYDVVRRDTPVKWYHHEKLPIYEKDSYLSLLQKNCENLGIPYKDPNLPDAPVRSEVVRTTEPELTFLDRVYVKLRVLKNGIVRVKIDTSFASMYENYYESNKQPPLKVLTQSYKSVGFSDTFLQKIKDGFAKNAAKKKVVSKAIEKIFDKQTTKKPKKAPPREDVEEDVVEEEDEEEEEEAAPEDEGMDVEVEPEDEVVEDDAYISGPDDD